MRTTLTLPDSFHRRIVELARTRNMTFKAAVAEIVGFGLEAVEGMAASPHQVVLKTHKGGPSKPEYDFAKVSELLDISEGEDRRW